MKRIIFAAALTALALPAHADITVNARASSLGTGAEVAFPLLSSTDARIGFNTFSYGFKQTTTSGGNSTDFDGDLKLQSLQALVDWHPFDGSFRMSGGLMYNGNQFSMTARPTGGTINVGGVPYAATSASVNATVDFAKVVPYLGIGWGRTPHNTGLSFTSDIGIMFQGTPKATLTTTGIPDPSGTLVADTARAKADMEDALKNFKAYPVISFGIGYTF